MSMNSLLTCENYQRKTKRVGALSVSFTLLGSVFALGSNRA